jgi:hypothetical protein
MLLTSVIVPSRGEKRTWCRHVHVADEHAVVKPTPELAILGTGHSTRAVFRPQTGSSVHNTPYDTLQRPLCVILCCTRMLRDTRTRPAVG